MNRQTDMQSRKTDPFIRFILWMRVERNLIKRVRDKNEGDTYYSIDNSGDIPVSRREENAADNWE